MSLLPLQIILGFQVTAAVVIFIQLVAGDDQGGRAVRLQKVRRSFSAKERIENQPFGDDAR
jgi:hypothetical protein